MRRVGETDEALAVVDDVHRDEGPRVELGVVLGELSTGRTSRRSATRAPRGSGVGASSAPISMPLPAR